MKHKEVAFNVEKFSADLLTKRVVELRIGIREAAELIGTSAPTLSRLENKRLPDVYTYFYACRWLGKPMEYYFEGLKKKR